MYQNTKIKDQNKKITQIQEDLKLVKTQNAELRNQNDHVSFLFSRTLFFLTY